MRAALVVLMVCASTAAEPIRGQSLEPTGTWVALGLGAGAFSGETSGVMALEIAHQRGRHLFALWSSIVFEIFDDSVGDVGLLYGRSTVGGAGSASLAAGLSFVEASIDCPALFSGEVCDNGRTVGVPIVASASWRPARFIGLGVRTFLNINSIDPFFGAVAAIEIGALSRGTS